MILLDTIAYNTFLHLIRNEEVSKNSSLKKEEFKNFILNYQGPKYVTSATLFELYVKNLKNDDSDFSMFLKDFNALNQNNIKILNDSTWNFKWQPLANALKEGQQFNMNSFIDAKVNSEVTSIFRYCWYVVLIVTDVLFDEYGDEVNELLWKETLLYIQELINLEVRKYLTDYYYKKEVRKEAATKQFDHLLGYILTKIENIIKGKLTLQLKLPQQFLNEQFKDYPQLSQLTIEGGAKKAGEIVKKLSSNKIRKLITSKIEEAENTFKSKGNRLLTESDRIYYQEILIERALLEGYKVKKNDFTDCQIFSTLDLIPGGQNGTLITLDKTLKKLIQTKGRYYNQNIYMQFLLS